MCGVPLPVSPSQSVELATTAIMATDVEDVHIENITRLSGEGKIMGIAKTDSGVGG